MCISRSELNKVVEEYRSFRSMRDELEGYMKKLNAQMKEYLVENNQDELIGEDFKLRLSTVNKFYWNSSKLEDLLGSEVNEYKNPSSYQQLKVY